MHRRAQVLPASCVVSSAQIQAIQKIATARSNGCIYPPPARNKNTVPIINNPKKSAVAAAIQRTASAKQSSKALQRMFPVRLQSRLHPHKRASWSIMPRYSGKNSAPRNAMAARPRPLFKSWIPARNASETSLKVCPTMGTLPVRSWPVRSAARSSCNAVTRCNPSKSARNFPAQ